jgi:hypothetical protein
MANQENMLSHDCLNCGAWQVDYSGTCRECGHKHEIEREDTEHGSFTVLH